MPTVFEVGIREIGDLDALQLTDLLRRLLEQELRRFGISAAHADVALQINIPDGGEDGRVRWIGEVPDACFLASNFHQFQVKAMAMGPAACANELVNSAGNLNPQVASALDDGASYVVFPSCS